MIQRRLEEELPFLVTEAVLMRAVRRGGDRQDLHERIRRHALEAADALKSGAARNDLIERIAGDAAFGLTREEILATFDPARHVGRAPEQVDAFLKTEVDPVLERLGVAEPVPELRA